MTFQDDLNDAERMIDELSRSENYDELIAKLEEIDTRMKELVARIEQARKEAERAEP
jgi:hypothetical protein